MDEVSGEYVYMKYEEKKVKSNTLKILCAPSKKFKKKRAVLQFAVWKHLVSAQVSDWRKKQRFPKFK